MFLSSSSFYVLSLVVISALCADGVLADNDWDTPCLSGSCSFEAGDGISTAYHLIAVNGSSTTLSDITPAAGWSITSCISNSSAPQTIQVTCDPSGPNAANCEHLIAGDVVNKVVRLPEGCGSGPFARVAAWSNSTANVKRDDGAVVNSCTFDYNFTQIPASSAPLSFTLYGTSAQNALANLTTAAQSSLSAQKRAYPRRGLAPRSLISSLIGALSSATSITEDVNVNKTLKFAPSSAITLIDQNADCGNGKGKEELKVTLKPEVTARVELAFAVTGSIVPPKLDDIAINAQVNTDAQAALDVSVDLKGSISTGSIPLFTIGLPGLDVPGIFTLGPSFSINAQATLSADAAFEAVITLQDTLPGLEFNFPPKNGKSSVGKNKVGTNSLKLEVDASGKIAGDAKLELIPRLDFGINVLDGLAKTDVFLQADFSADLQASVSASLNETISNSGSNNTNSNHNSTSSYNSTSLNYYNGSSITNTTSSIYSSNSTSLPTGKGNNTASSKGYYRRANAAKSSSISGNVKLSLEVDVSAGADESLLDIFDASQNIPIFDQTFVLVDKNFGSTKRRRNYFSQKRRAGRQGSRSGVRPSNGVIKRASLTCTNSLLSDLVSVL